MYNSVYCDIMCVAYTYFSMWQVIFYFNVCHKKWETMNSTQRLFFIQRNIKTPRRRLKTYDVEEVRNVKQNSLHLYCILDFLLFYVFETLQKKQAHCNMPVDSCLHKNNYLSSLIYFRVFISCLKSIDRKNYKFSFH